MNKEELQKLTEIDQRSKSNTKRLDKLDEKVENIYDLTLSVKELATEIKTMREDMQKIDERLVDVESKPVKRYEGIVDKIIYLILGAVITFLLAHVGIR